MKTAKLLRMALTRQIPRTKKEKIVLGLLNLRAGGWVLRGIQPLAL